METHPAHVAASELSLHWVKHLGPLTLSKVEIMSFASLVDPQPLHIDTQFAAGTRFGGVIASGLHPYVKFHSTYWVDMMREHFICGLSIDGGEFFLPVYPDMPIYGELRVIRLEPKPEKQTQIVGWQWNFYGQDPQMAPEAPVLSYFKLTSYHQL